MLYHKTQNRAIPNFHFFNFFLLNFNRLSYYENLKLRDEFDNVIRRVGNFEADLRTIRSLIDILNGLRMPDEKNETACCPLCGAEPAHWTRDLNNLEETSEHLRKELDISRSEHAALKKRLDAWEKAEKRNEAIQAERKEVGEQLDRFREQLKACPDHDPQAATKLEQLNGRVQIVRETSIKLEHEEKRITSETESRDKYQNERDILYDNIRNIEDEMNRVLEAAGGLTLGDLEPTREEIRKREARIETIRQQEKRIAELEGKKEESERQLERLNRQFEDQCRMRDNFAGANVWFDKCEQALRWLHKDGLPRLIHASVLKDLVQVINYELRQYNEPFNVSVNEDLTFRVHFPDGTQGVSTSISGGQRYLLVLSFLMAMNRTFAQNLGIMFLDEPTAFLDEENVMFLTKILEQLKRILRSRGQQLVIVTHVETLATIADTVYSLVHLRQSI